MSEFIIEHSDKPGMYRGQVKLIYKHGNQPYKIIEKHNEGTAAFFEYLLRCVKGDASVSDRPGYIKLFSGQDYSGQLFNFGILYDTASAVTTQGNQAQITLSFFIPDSLVVGKTIRSLQLCSMNSALTVYALVNLESAETIGANTNIEILWTLSLTN